MSAQWIDFKALKANVSLKQVLDHYGFTAGLRSRGPDKLIGPCPIHRGKNPGSFHVDLSKNAFHCFSACGGGNVLDFVGKVEQCGVREAAEKITTWFGLTFDREARGEKTANASEKSGTPSAAVAAARQGEQQVNPPLERPLTLKHDHPYLFERGLTVETIKTFAVGFASRGIMRGRIAIPIHDERGELVAYAGRAVTDELAKEQGKYKLPNGFKKSHVVWNLNRAKAHAERGLIVVEGFFGAIKVHQAGFPNVVALMGSTLSEQQEELLLHATDCLVLMFDGDDAGTACLREFYRRLRRRLFLKEVHLEDGEQPDTLTDARLKALLS